VTADERPTRVPVTPVPERVSDKPTFGWAAFRQGVRTQILITGQAAVGTGLIAGDAGGLADHDAANASALLALAVSNLARGRERTTAIGSGLIRRDVFGTGDGLTGTGLIARHFSERPTSLPVTRLPWVVAETRTFAGVVFSGAD